MKEIKEKIKKVFESKMVLKILLILGILVVAAFIFQAGFFVGFRKASFGRDWGENYGRNFGMMNGRGGFGGMMGNFPNAHGAIGKIIKIELPILIVQDKDNIEKIVIVTNDTKIINIRNEDNIQDLKIDENIVVIGTPNSQGQIEAKLIRIMPFPAIVPLNNINIPIQVNSQIKQ
ncbi:MAG: hypothetical protein WAV23_00295 [Minisyncoccia bacterium]